MTHYDTRAHSLYLSHMSDAMAGHSETMLYANYRALVTPEAAGEFWATRPSGDQ